MSGATAIELGHAFPTYSLVAVGGHPSAVEKDPEGDGDYVHSLHAQALAERVILARIALRQGRAGKASEILDEACEYLSRKSHTR